MRTRLSSPFTFFFKVIFPFLWLGLGLIGVINTFREFRGIELIELIKVLILPGIWLGVSFGVFYWNDFPVKRVYLDDQVLHVSNYIRQTSIPLALIHTVNATGGGSWWRWPPYRVIITFKSTSDFGNEIKFIPGFDYKEVVQLLRGRIVA